MPSLTDIPLLIKQSAHDAGFDLCGIAPVRHFAELEAFPKWIASGHAGEMKYMEARDEAGDLKRASLRTVAPWARSVIVCAINYNTAQPYSTQVRDCNRGWISRYAWSREDYHKSVMRRLRILEDRVKQIQDTQFAAENSANATADDESWKRGPSDPHSRAPSTHKQPWKRGPSGRRPSASKEGASASVTRCYVDTGPLVERVYAKYASIGWIGKNTCVLNQKMGSWLFLGVILTSLELTPDLPAPDRCGTCTRCIDACPTDALIAPYQLDSNRCISYLTIEKRGSIPQDLRDGMGRHVFGCDICQDVCPWNRRAPATSATEFQAREGLVNPALDWLVEMTLEEFQKTFRGSPVRRAKRTGLRRNAVIAMGNSGDRRFLPLLQKLSADDDPVVAEHARWAAAKLSTS